MKIISAIVLASCLFTSERAVSQSFSIDWFTIDGGGGTSTGGAFSVSGTIAQPDAGALSGGNFTLQGGFWAVALVQDTNGPLLRIRLNGSGGVESAWPYPSSGFILQETAAVPATEAQWMNVAAAPSHVGDENVTTVPSPSGIRFYRLRKP